MAQDDPSERQRYLKILGLKPGATEDEVKRAYKTLALKYHPDKNPDDEEATEQFQELSHAYRMLSHTDYYASCACGATFHCPCSDDDDEDFYDDDEEFQFFFDMFYELLFESINRRRFASKRKKKSHQTTPEEEEEERLFEFLYKKKREQEEEEQDDYVLTEEDLRRFHSYDAWAKEKNPNKRANAKTRRAKRRANRPSFQQPKPPSKKSQLALMRKREKEMQEIGEQIKSDIQKKQEKEKLKQQQELQDQELKKQQKLKEQQELKKQQEEKDKENAGKQQSLIAKKHRLSESDTSLMGVKNPPSKANTDYASPSKKQKRKESKMKKREIKNAAVEELLNRGRKGEESAGKGDGQHIGNGTVNPARTESYMKFPSQAGDASDNIGINSGVKTEDACKIEKAPLKPDVDTQERNRQLQDFLDKVRTKRHVDTGGLSQSEREAKANKFWRDGDEAENEEEKEEKAQKQQLLEKHLAQYHELMKQQPRRHTEQQLRQERERKKAEEFAKQQQELQKLRQEHQSYLEKTMDSTNEGLKKAPHLLVRNRDKEEDRYPEINRKTKTKQTRKRQQGTGWRHLEMTEVPPRFARLMEEEKSKEEEEIKSRIFIGSSGRPSPAPPPVVNRWMERKCLLDSLQPQDEMDEEAMLQRALQLSQETLRQENEWQKLQMQSLRINGNPCVGAENRSDPQPSSKPESERQWVLKTAHDKASVLPTALSLQSDIKKKTNTEMAKNQHFPTNSQDKASMLEDIIRSSQTLSDGLQPIDKSKLHDIDNANYHPSKDMESFDYREKLESHNPSLYGYHMEYEMGSNSDRFQSAATLLEKESKSGQRYIDSPHKNLRDGDKFGYQDNQQQQQQQQQSQGRQGFLAGYAHISGLQEDKGSNERLEQLERDPRHGNGVVIDKGLEGLDEWDEIETKGGATADVPPEVFEEELPPLVEYTDEPSENYSRFPREIPDYSTVGAYGMDGGYQVSERTSAALEEQDEEEDVELQQALLSSLSADSQQVPSWREREPPQQQQEKACGPSWYNTTPAVSLTCHEQQGWMQGDEDWDAEIEQLQKNKPREVGRSIDIIHGSQPEVAYSGARPKQPKQILKLPRHLLHPSDRIPTRDGATRPVTRKLPSQDSHKSPAGGSLESSVDQDQTSSYSTYAGTEPLVTQQTLQSSQHSAVSSLKSSAIDGQTSSYTGTKSPVTQQIPQHSAVSSLTSSALDGQSGQISAGHHKGVEHDIDTVVAAQKASMAGDEMPNQEQLSIFEKLLQVNSGLLNVQKLGSALPAAPNPVLCGPADSSLLNVQKLGSALPAAPNPVLCGSADSGLLNVQNLGSALPAAPNPVLCGPADLALLNAQFGITPLTDLTSLLPPSDSGRQVDPLSIQTAGGAHVTDTDTPRGPQQQTSVEAIAPNASASFSGQTGPSASTMTNTSMQTQDGVLTASISNGRPLSPELNADANFKQLLEIGFAQLKAGVAVTLPGQIKGKGEGEEDELKMNHQVQERPLREHDHQHVSIAVQTPDLDKSGLRELEAQARRGMELDHQHLGVLPGDPEVYQSRSPSPEPVDRQPHLEQDIYNQQLPLRMPPLNPSLFPPVYPMPFLPMPMLGMYPYPGAGMYPGFYPPVNPMMMSPEYQQQLAQSQGVFMPTLQQTPLANLLPSNTTTSPAIPEGPSSVQNTSDQRPQRNQEGCNSRAPSPLGGCVSENLDATLTDVNFGLKQMSVSSSSQGNAGPTPGQQAGGPQPTSTADSGTTNQTDYDKMQCNSENVCNYGRSSHFKEECQNIHPDRAIRMTRAKKPPIAPRFARLAQEQELEEKRRNLLRRFPKPRAPMQDKQK